ncbi:cytochrome c oxidase subunit II [Sphingomonas qomolangmaensis]|uniref:Cytochrome c oxidase subunit 2 n=1 Tax=Sphingomonas qomolangmaensis TaxID=2918765 RepID=A0ABY5L3R0_9SPHN|nr:cytochrome c oxidase subunit II [Sphingomonas qomolangmaensis]UUL81595.1 cytochrome c oxidase subunit II [Sphingomonas qomolangmaensis]
MNGFKTILVAAGLACAGTAIAQEAVPAAPVSAPAAAQPGTPATTGPDSESAVTATAAEAASPADPTLNADGSPRLIPADGIGQPTNRSIGIQPQVTDLGDDAKWFHNVILVPVITIISLFVLGLLVWVVIRYRRAANPVPSKTSHNTMIEIVWTAAPVIILALIAIPSIRLLAAQYEPAPANAITLKAIGNQWYWSYEYPDHGGVAITANMLKEQSEVEAGQRFRTPADGPRLLAVDNRIVLPVGVPIRLITTANDVIHSWAMPAFWIKMDAVPGRLNETSFTIREPGLYFGQCSELCGSRHAFMPIAVEAVSPEVFAQWIRAKGGAMPGQGAAPAAQVPTGSAGSIPTEAGADAGDDTTAPDNATGPTVDATTQAPTTTQAASGNAGGLGNVDQ